MQTLKVASLSEGNKSAYTANGNRYFIPNRFRTNVKIGDYMLVVTKTFSSRTDDAGNVVPCEPWTREEITMLGSYDAVTIAKNEDKINAGLESAIVNREIKALAKSFDLTAELNAVVSVI